MVAQYLSRRATMAPLCNESGLRKPWILHTVGTSVPCQEQGAMTQIANVTNVQSSDKNKRFAAVLLETTKTTRMARVHFDKYAGIPCKQKMGVKTFYG